MADLLKAGEPSRPEQMMLSIPQALAVASQPGPGGRTAHQPYPTNTAEIHLPPAKANPGFLVFGAPEEMPGRRVGAAPGADCPTTAGADHRFEPQDQQQGEPKSPGEITKDLKAQLAGGDPNAIAKFISSLQKTCEQLHGEGDVQRYLADLSEKMPPGLQLEITKGLSHLSGGGVDLHPGFDIRIAGGESAPTEFKVGAHESSTSTMKLFEVSGHIPAAPTYEYVLGHVSKFEPVQVMDVR